jgi:hypothetical protein
LASGGALLQSGAHATLVAKSNDLSARLYSLVIAPLISAGCSSVNEIA